MFMFLLRFWPHIIAAVFILATIVRAYNGGFDSGSGWQPGEVCYGATNRGC